MFCKVMNSCRLTPFLENEEEKKTAWLLHAGHVVNLSVKATEEAFGK
jgi:hypothetical protein